MTREQGSAGDQLLARARRGDLAALETLYRLHEGVVYDLARRICRRPEDAEEVLQETFIEVARSLRQYRGEGSLSGWIRTIAARKALARLRRERIRHADPLDDEAVLVDPAPGPTSAHRRLDLEAALHTLSANARAVLWLHDVEGYTHEEIAELAQRSVSFSKSHLARAHRRLRELIGERP
ncbi:MAG TPA: RNA polymerase sigma factor [Thermoanaerobaculia bacterium]|nr:RNA polymerase sigma factor [Thermoanaerobaculia bacterium]